MMTDEWSVFSGKLKGSGNYLSGVAAYHAVYVVTLVVGMLDCWPRGHQFKPLSPQNSLNC